ncbi:uncharacterized protein MYCFIDRAFT_205672 [Pseudocercospora fijiensis CIRAD86]|uniref:Uncharacterized protein n=1 Tax=Pseudocercospora fijiensis (strain CIRAD86) TaxID=383855 RepID=N1Q975_PSEFD|nr:uncharacterized protein MYCFIDRAFT_205672 [Pseudocercospora fijiensis CIRAD86]EME87443.1 hypothetical protein MYCFIDRAFT_205672 [Pseudocercospora fijiensis CIRAD86]
MNDMSARVVRIPEGCAQMVVVNLVMMAALALAMAGEAADMHDGSPGRDVADCCCCCCCCWWLARARVPAQCRNRCAPVARHNSRGLSEVGSPWKVH